MKKKLAPLLLDSSLISRTIPFLDYDIKLIKCGNYVQIYKRSNKQSRVVEGFEKEKKKKLDAIHIYYDDLKNRNILKICNDIDDEIIKYDTVQNQFSDKILLEKNVIRAKNNMCRLIFSNEDKFKTFITLTFNDDIFDLEIANYEFQKFIRKLKRALNYELFYVAVPEFQKNGRVHFHLITNIDYNDKTVINENITLNKLYHKHSFYYSLVRKNLTALSFSYNIYDVNLKLNIMPVVLRKQGDKWHNTKKTYNFKNKSFKIFKTMKYWNCGFSNIMELDFVCGKRNVARYMAKYMLKDMDKRMWGKRKYFYSLNLNRPEIFYLDSSNLIDDFVVKSSSNILFEKEYTDYFGNIVQFTEFEDFDLCQYIKF